MIYCVIAALVVANVVTCVVLALLRDDLGGVLSGLKDLRERVILAESTAGHDDCRAELARLRDDLDGSRRAAAVAASALTTCCDHLRHDLDKHLIDSRVRDEALIKAIRPGPVAADPHERRHINELA